MDDALQRMAGLAWRTVPAREANEAIARARRATAAAEVAARRGELDAAFDEEDGGDGPMARAYELALAPGATFASFAREQLPRLVYHLESIGAHLPHVGGIVICLFSGEQLHFIQAGELLSAVCAELAVTPEELVQRYGTGELRTAVHAGPPPAPPVNPAFALALPPAGKAGEKS